jgi:hypothetical protein
MIEGFDGVRGLVSDPVEWQRPSKTACGLSENWKVETEMSQERASDSRRATGAYETGGQELKRGHNAVGGPQSIHGQKQTW